MSLNIETLSADINTTLTETLEPIFQELFEMPVVDSIDKLSPSDQEAIRQKIQENAEAWSTKISKGIAEVLADKIINHFKDNAEIYNIKVDILAENVTSVGIINPLAPPATIPLIPSVPFIPAVPAPQNGTGKII